VFEDTVGAVGDIPLAAARFLVSDPLTVVADLGNVA